MLLLVIYQKVKSFPKLNNGETLMAQAYYYFYLFSFSHL